MNRKVTKINPNTERNGPFCSAASLKNIVQVEPVENWFINRFSTGLSADRQAQADKSLKEMIVFSN